MSSHDPLDMIHDALSAHDIPAARRPDSVELARHDLRFTVRIFGREQNDWGHKLILAIRIFSPRISVQPITESFVGWGKTPDQALEHAFEKFLRGVFHVLIEGLAGHVGDDMQSEIEHWSRGDTAWKVFAGLIIPEAVDEATLATTYQDFYAELADLFAATASPGGHFVRVFLGTIEGKVAGGEVLLDNETWPQAEALLFGQPWQCGQEYQAVRQVILTLPLTEPGS
jgi:hypothetical protein